MAAITTLLGLVTPSQGSLSGTWGDTVNYGITEYVDIAIAGTLSFAGDGAITLANTTGSSAGTAMTSTTAQYMVIRITGTQTVTKVITGPSYSKLYMVDHAGATSAVTFKAAAQTGISVAVGEKCFVYYNGSDYVKVASSVADGVTTINFGSTGLTPNTATSGAVTVAGTLVVANGGTGVTTSTGTTNVVLSNSPTLVTPAITTSLTTASTTFALLNTTATTINFGGAATTIDIGAATGTITLGNPTLTGTTLATFNMNGASPSIVTTSAGTASVFNTGALTGNLFGAATTVNMGAATGTMTVANTTLAAKAITASTTLGVTGATTLSSALTYGGVTLTNAVTGTGKMVLDTSPTLVTPDLGTPSALVGTNITGTATAFTASNVTTNANLTGDVTSVGNATTLTNAPVIAKVLTGYVSGAGTVAATDSILQAIQKLDGNNATNANLTGMVTSVGNATTVVTNANLTGGVTSVGNATTVVTNANLTGAVTSVGNATSLGSFTSAQLLAALTNETGTGVAVFGTSPTFTTSVVGGATMAVFNTASTTINAFGAATTVNIGAATGTATVNNTTLAAKAITASTTLGVTGVSTLTGGAIVQGLTVGLGGGAVSNNTAVGDGALIGNTTGSDNTAIGSGALYLNTVGIDNTAIGRSALGTNNIGTKNTAVGYEALYSNTSGNYNAAYGYQALYNIVGLGHDSNTAIGYQALHQNTTGTNNTAIGSGSGGGITTGDYNVVIGGYTGFAAPISETGSNYIVLSDGAGTVRQTIDPSGNAQFPTGAVVVYAPAPASFSALATLTNANLQTQLIVTTGTAYTLTMPTGSTLDTLISWSSDDIGFDFSIVNTASGTVTMAVNTGVTNIGTLTVLTGISARFRIRRTSASNYILYRIG